MGAHHGARKTARCMCEKNAFSPTERIRMSPRDMTGNGPDRLGVRRVYSPSLIRSREGTSQNKPDSCQLSISFSACIREHRGRRERERERERRFQKKCTPFPLPSLTPTVVTWRRPTRFAALCCGRTGSGLCPQRERRACGLGPCRRSLRVEPSGRAVV